MEDYCLNFSRHQPYPIAGNDSGKTVVENVDRTYKTTSPTSSGGATAASIAVTDQSKFDVFFKSNYDAVTPANNNFSLVVDAANNYEIKKNGASLSPAVTGTYSSGTAINFNGFALKFAAFSKGALVKGGSVSNKAAALQKELDTNSTDQTRVNDRAAAFEARLRKQYSALDAKMASLNALNAYVSQQVTTMVS